MLKKTGFLFFEQFYIRCGELELALPALRSAIFTAVYTMGLLSYLDSFRYILTLWDELLKYIIVHPIAKKGATTNAKTIVVLNNMNLLRYLSLTTEFKAKLLKSICDMLGIAQVF